MAKSSAWASTPLNEGMGHYKQQKQIQVQKCILLGFCCADYHLYPQSASQGSGLSYAILSRKVQHFRHQRCLLSLKELQMFSLNLFKPYYGGFIYLEIFHKSPCKGFFIRIIISELLILLGDHGSVPINSAAKCNCNGLCSRDVYKDIVATGNVFMDIIGMISELFHQVIIFQIISDKF